MRVLGFLFGFLGFFRCRGGRRLAGDALEMEAEDAVLLGEGLVELVIEVLDLFLHLLDGNLLFIEFHVFTDEDHDEEHDPADESDEEQEEEDVEEPSPEPEALAIGGKEGIIVVEFARDLAPGVAEGVREELPEVAEEGA